MSRAVNINSYSRGQCLLQITCYEQDTYYKPVVMLRSRALDPPILGFVVISSRALIVFATIDGLMVSHSIFEEHAYIVEREGSCPKIT